jgi:hypothetical protein
MRQRLNVTGLIRRKAAAERWRSIKVTEFENRQITAVQKRTRSGIRDPSRSQNTAFKGCRPGENIQQLSDLTGDEREACELNPQLNSGAAQVAAE